MTAYATWLVGPRLTQHLNRGLPDARRAAGDEYASSSAVQW
jgi:hypothetical protein